MAGAVYVPKRAESHRLSGLDPARLIPVTSARSNRSLDTTSASGSLFPTYFPIARRTGAHPPPASPAALPRTAPPRGPQHTPKLDPSLWPAIAKRARHESLRHLAAEYGVSYETIRTIVKREIGRGNMAAD